MFIWLSHYRHFEFLFSVHLDENKQNVDEFFLLVLLFFCIRKEVVVVDQVQTSPFASKKNTEPMGGAYTVARKCERCL